MKEIFSRQERLENSILDDLARSNFGFPEFFWDAPPRPQVCSFGPEPFRFMETDFEYYVPVGTRKARLVRVGHSEVYVEILVKMRAGRCQREATREFALRAYRGVQAFEKAEWDKAELERCRPEREAAEAKERVRKRTGDRLAHEAWISRVRVDLDRVLNELREDRDAVLGDWTVDPDWNPSAEVVAQREQYLAEIALQIQKAEANRLELRERRANEAAHQSRMARLNGPIPLALDEGGIVFGTNVTDGTNLIWPVQKIQHMLVGGMTGGGKSVFLHQMAYQLLQSTGVDRVVLIDLKGGTEFDRYRDEPKALVVWTLSDAIKVFDEVVAVLDAREAELREKRLRDWNKGRVFVIVDEYAEIHDSIHEARRGEDKETAHRLANNLKRIIRRARSLGVVMICALQKATTDAMDSSLRANMNLRACFRVKTRQTAEATLDGYDDLPVDPLTLRKGRFVFDDGRGNYHHLQAQIAPGVELNND